MIVDNPKSPRPKSQFISPDEGIGGDWIKFARPSSSGWQRTDAEIMRMYGITLDELQSIGSYRPESERLGQKASKVEDREP